MAIEIYLGNIPANREKWIKDHSGPVTRVKTRIWWSNNESDYSDCSSNNGTFDDTCFPDGKYPTDSVKIEFGTDVNAITDSIFTMSQNLVAIIISNTVRTIGESSFGSCENLTTITIPDSVITIGSGAFDSSSSLTIVTITANGGNANNVKHMMIDAGVSSSITWNMPSHPETRFTLQGGTIETYNIIGTLDMQWMIQNGYYNTSTYQWEKIITHADIGNTVTSIGGDSFSGCYYLTNVIIPDSVKSIGDEAFHECLNLMSVTIPNGVTRVGEYAFFGCTNLTSVTIPDSVTSIEEYAFSNCTNLTSVTITTNGGDAEYIKQMIIDSIDNTSISDNIEWIIS